MSLYQPIMAALLTHLQNDCGVLFKTYSRHLMMYQDLIQRLSTPQAVPQPALYVYHGPGFGGGSINYQQAGRTPGRRTISASLIIYAQIPNGGEPSGVDQTTVGADVFYPLIEAIESSLEPDPSSSFGVQTLGNTVLHCWIEGDAIIIPGDIDPQGQGMAALPINILIP